MEIEEAALNADRERQKAGDHDLDWLWFTKTTEAGDTLDKPWFFPKFQHVTAPWELLWEDSPPFRGSKPLPMSCGRVSSANGPTS